MMMMLLLMMMNSHTVFTSAKAKVMWSDRFVCHSFCHSQTVCVHDYCKSNQPISLKLGVMIKPTSRKNWLTFGGNPVPIGISFPHHCGIGDSRRFISISHTVSHRPIFTRLGEVIDADKLTKPQHFGSDPADIQIRSEYGLIRTSGFESWLRFWPW